jgi:CheY-like chemotaxis protein
VLLLTSAMLAALLLLRRAGYRALLAKDGGEGVRLAREGRPDLVVTDLGLPVVDGWCTTELLKQDAATAHIPAIAITAHVQMLLPRARAGGRLRRVPGEAVLSGAAPRGGSAPARWPVGRSQSR